MLRLHQFHINSIILYCYHSSLLFWDKVACSWQMLGSYFFWASCSNHCLAALDLRAGVEQTFDYRIIHSSSTVRPCSPWWGRWIRQWRTTWSTVCSSVPHSQAAEKAIPYLYKQEWKHPNLVQRRLSWTQALLGRVIPGEWVPVSGMKMQSCGTVCPLHFSLLICPVCRTYVVR